jgi:GDP-L-fucose synthase
MNIIITGGTGLVGSALASTSCDKNINCIQLNSKHCDLKDYNQSLKVISEIHRSKPISIIIHCAARVGGLYRNMREPVEMMNDNLLINTNILNIAHLLNINKVVCVLSTCIFPDKVEYPIKVEDLHMGPPHSSNEGYAYAKRILEVQCKAFRKQYDREYYCVIPTNIYGENDNFNPNDSHVIPGLIYKAVKSKIVGKELNVSGNGSHLRQFIFNIDLANIIWWSIKEYKHFDIPLICCPKNEISISEVAETIAKIVELEKVVYTNEEGGQYKKTCLDTNTQLKELGYSKQFIWTPLEKGLKYTIMWYMSITSK